MSHKPSLSQRYKDKVERTASELLSALEDVSPQRGTSQFVYGTFDRAQEMHRERRRTTQS